MKSPTEVKRRAQAAINELENQRNILAKRCIDIAMEASATVGELQDKIVQLEKELADKSTQDNAALQ